MLTEEQIRDRMLNSLYQIPKNEEDFYVGKMRDFFINSSNLLSAQIYAEILEDKETLQYLSNIQKNLFDKKK